MMRRENNPPVLIDPFFVDGPNLYRTAAERPDEFMTRIPEPERRFMTEIPLAASGLWPEAERAALRSTLAAADARASAKMDR
ncbi:hypothetical protein [Tsukamurella sp. NPDC003166]|uniref:hypothetical protein n=1 Tax=Tsukamurella sp. NPDC003166 TaxID=3154444 RepID=UPI0033AF372B